jgi:serine/threonine-protein kinase RsbW
MITRSQNRQHVPKNSKPKPLRFEIPSELSRVSRILAQVQKELQRKHYSENTLFAIRLALEEALVNAIKHGNCQDHNKKVRVEVHVSPSQVQIAVEDEGCGFDRKRIPDPRLEENLTKCGGRGLLLIEAYMSKVKWSHGGRRLEMMKNNEPDLLPRRSTATQ